MDYLSLTKEDLVLKLQESEDKYRKLFDSEKDAIIMFDAETTDFVEVNNAAAKLYGYSKEEFLKLKHKDISAEIDKSNESIKDIFVKKRAKIPIRFHKKKDGTVFPVEITGSVYKLKERKIICGIVRDISGRYRAEEDLKQSERKFKGLFNSNMIGMAFWDKNSNLTDANDKFLEITGYSRKDITSGKIKLGEITPREYSNLDSKAIEEINKKGYCKPFEKEYIKKDGSRVPVLMGGASIKGITEGSVSWVIDLTERKLAEKTLHFQAALLENISDAVITTDIEFRILTWNKTAGRLYGFSCKEVVGRTLGSIIPTYYVNSSEEEVISTFRETGSWEGELKQKTKNGDDIYISSSINLIKDNKSEPPYVIVINRDYTERKKVQHELYDEHIALSRVLHHLESDREDYKNEICLNIERLFKPIIKLLKQVNGILTPKDIDILEHRLGKIIARDPNDFKSNFGKLTPREIDVCERIKTGMSSKEIAEYLHIHPETVNMHRKSIRKKLNLKNNNINLSTYLCS